MILIIGIVAAFIAIPVAIYHLCVLLVGLAAGALWICLHVLTFVLGAITLGLEALMRGLEAWLAAS